MRITTNSKQKGGFFMEQIAIFCDTDDFCKAYEEYCRNKLLMDKEEVIPRTRMSLSEIMTILIMYQLSGYKTFKWYYTKHLMKHQRKDFPDLLYYILSKHFLASVQEYLLLIPHH